MKICLINNLYEPWARGGAETIVKILFDEAEKQNHQVFTISTKPCQASSPQSDQHYYLPSLYFDLAKIPVFIRLFWHLADTISPLTIWRIWRIWQKEKPDLVFGHNLKGLSLLLPRLAKKMNIPYFHLLHDIQLIHPSGLLYGGEEKVLEAWPTRLYTALSRFLINSPDLVISPSAWLLEEHKKRNFFPKSKTEVILNPFNFKGETSNKKEKGAVFTWLFVGQIEEHKGVRLLLEAYADFRKTADEASQLWLVGSGQLLEKLQAEFSGQADIKFFGRLTKDEVAELMKKSHCLVLPSICYENSPTVIYEATALGLPALVSNLGGAGEIANYFNHSTFKALNKNELAQKMLDIVKNPPSSTTLLEKKIIGAQEYWKKILENKKDPI